MDRTPSNSRPSFRRSNARCKLRHIILPALLLASASASAATVQWTQTFTSNGHNFTLNSNADDTNPTTIPSLIDSTMDGNALSLLDPDTYGGNDNYYSPPLLGAI